MKKTWILMLLIFFVLGFWLFVPPYQKDKIIGVFTAGQSDRKCFNFHKQYYKDPETAYFVDSYVWSKENELSTGTKYPDPAFEKYDTLIRVEVQAKNGFGAYIKEFIECPLIDGKFDDYEALIHRINNSK
ncbi:hypothetical protein [Cognaticolwellia beringensis]|uniref:Uncharacterized protein n=1 Tax=Cognaticolwellia beringensis TaxID=1967665 RepID=A0A222G5R4_9GAMM|nr:hypothetical protein [Cognaticolwellia beringensis]ASP47130.1 hypothetical protein B5D82_04730 [Cognaticolwellia beringensis]